MTEAEAKTKWCPMTGANDRIMALNYWREKPDDAASILGGPYNKTCIGSDCMAWRWQKWKQDGGPDVIELAGNGEPLGYCGMAGKP